MILNAITISIASPCVITSVGHLCSDYEQVGFTTTGALPTGIVAGTTYYVKKIDADTFKIAATPGGADINTSGTQSGTQAANVRRILVTAKAGLLSAADTFYRVEAANLMVNGSGTGITVNTGAFGAVAPNLIPVNFANAGDCQEVGLALTYNKSTVYPTSDIKAGLQESMGTCTISNGSPAIVTFAGHGLADLTPIIIESSGTLPTGLTKGRYYYLRYIGVDTFNLSTTPTGALINTSSAGSGTHTLWADRATETYDYAKITTTGTTSGVNYGLTLYTPFEFTSPYAVDTTASKWRFTIQQITSTSCWTLGCSDTGNLYPFYFSNCDNAITFANNDCLVVTKKLTIDQTASIQGVLGTGAGTYADSVCGVVCRSGDATEANVALLTWDETPASSYTFTIDGNLYASGSYSGLRIGTSTNKIPYAQQAIIKFQNYMTYPGGNTLNSAITFADSGLYNGKMSLFMYGQIPTVPKTTIVGDVAVGANTLTTAVATGWSIGNTFHIGKADLYGVSDVDTLYTITNIVGDAITFSPNLSTTKRKSGATIFVNEGYGIKLTSSTTTRISIINITSANYVHIEGVHHVAAGYRNSNQTSQSTKDADAYTSRFVFKNNLFYSAGTTGYQLVFQAFLLPEVGIEFDSCIFKRCVPVNGYNGGPTYYNNGAGIVDIHDCFFMGMVNYGVFFPTASLNIGWKFNRNTVNNVSQYNSSQGMQMVGGEITDNDFWGLAVGDPGSGYAGTGIAKQSVVDIQTWLAGTFTGNKFNKCYVALSFSGGVTSELIASGNLFGNESANILDMGFQYYTYVNSVFKSQTTSAATYPILNQGEINKLLVGSSLQFPSFNSTNNDYTYTPYGNIEKTGSGLNDTTLRTTGTFPMRMESTSSAVNVPYQFDMPIGNQQGKTISIGLWVYINNTAYDAGTHEMPRIKVNYDNGTETNDAENYATATFGAWQYIKATFTPTTTFASITISLSARTDAVSSNRYVYWADWSGGFLVNNEFIYWKDALPVPPGFSANVNAATFWDYPTSAAVATGSMGEVVVSGNTGITAADVWNVQTSTLTTAGTIGKFVTKLLSVAKFLGLK